MIRSAAVILGFGLLLTLLGSPSTPAAALSRQRSNTPGVVRWSGPTPLATGTDAVAPHRPDDTAMSPWSRLQRLGDNKPAPFGSPWFYVGLACVYAVLLGLLLKLAGSIG